MLYEKMRTPLEACLPARSMRLLSAYRKLAWRCARSERPPDLGRKSPIVTLPWVGCRLMIDHERAMRDQYFVWGIIYLTNQHTDCSSNTSS